MKWENIIAQFTESEFTLRSLTLHGQQCKYIEKIGITNSEKTHFSSTYGMNRRSALAGFDVTDQLPQGISYAFVSWRCVFIQQFYWSI